MDTAPIRIFHLRGRTVQLLAGALLLLVAFRTVEENFWKSMLVFVGSLPVLITPMLLRTVEVADGWLRVCLRIGHFTIGSKDSSVYKHRSWLGGWDGLLVRTHSYPIWALPFCWAMNLKGRGIILNPIFFVETASPPRMRWVETLSCLLILGLLLMLNITNRSIQFEDLRMSQQVLPLKLLPQDFDYICIIGPYRNKLLRGEAAELSEAQWQEASRFLEELYFDDDSIRGIVLVAKGGKFRSEKLQLVAGRDYDANWQETSFDGFMEQVCVRKPYYQLREFNSRKLFSLLARKS